jgi:DNA repair protein RadC
MAKHIISEIEVNYIPNKLSLISINEKKHMITCFRKSWDVNKIQFIEEFKVLILNNSNQPLGIVTLSKGGYSGTVVDIKILFAVVLKAGGSAFATCHNHPSGKLKASESDIRITNKINEGAKILDLRALDHFIITADDCINYNI